MRRQYRGNAQPTTLAAPVGLSDTTATLTDGSSYPDGTVGPFTLTIDSGAAGEEKWLVTSRSGNGLTGITRAYDGTPTASHSAGASVKHTISAVDLDEANAHLNTTTADDHTQYAKRGQGLAANVGAASRAGRLYIATDSEDLYADDGSTVHRYLSKPSSDAAYGALAWTSFTPVLGNVTVGNGTAYGYYRLVGKTLHLRVQLIFGTTTAFTGQAFVTLPASLAAAAGGGEQVVMARQYVGGVLYTGYANIPASGTAFAVLGPTSGTSTVQVGVDATHPGTWGSGANFVVQGAIEVS